MLACRTARLAGPAVTEVINERIDGPRMVGFQKRLARPRRRDPRLSRCLAEHEHLPARPFQRGRWSLGGLGARDGPRKTRARPGGWPMRTLKPGSAAKTGHVRLTWGAGAAGRYPGPTSRARCPTVGGSSQAGPDDRARAPASPAGRSRAGRPARVASGRVGSANAAGRRMGSVISHVFVDMAVHRSARSPRRSDCSSGRRPLRAVIAASSFRKGAIAWSGSS